MQLVNLPPDLGEEVSKDGGLRELKVDAAFMVHDLGADFDQFLAQGCQRLMFSGLRQRQPSKYSSEIVGQGMELGPDLVVAKAVI